MLLPSKGNASKSELCELGEAVIVVMATRANSHASGRRSWHGIASFPRRRWHPCGPEGQRSVPAAEWSSGPVDDAFGETGQRVVPKVAIVTVITATGRKTELLAQCARSPGRARPTVARAESVRRSRCHLKSNLPIATVGTGRFEPGLRPPEDRKATTKRFERSLSGVKLRQKLRHVRPLARFTDHWTDPQ